MRVNGHLFGEKLSLSGEMFSLLGVHYYFRLTSVYYVKSTKQILAGVRPPPSWQCQDFHGFCYGHPSLSNATTNLCSACELQICVSSLCRYQATHSSPETHSDYWLYLNLTIHLVSWVKVFEFNTYLNDLFSWH